MFKTCTKMLSIVLALLLVSASLACLAETERDNVIDGYEVLNERVHTVYVTIMEYPIIDGERGSGKPVGSDSYTENHVFEGGECIYCGYKLPTIIDIDDDDYDDDGDDDDDTVSTPANAGAPVNDNNFVTASGASVTKGMPAAEALKAALAAIPADTEVAITGVDLEVADDLLNAIQSGATPEVLLALLRDFFPVQNIDGVNCYVVTLSYTDAAGAAVTESYAFSVANGTLVKAF